MQLKKKTSWRKTYNNSMLFSWPAHQYGKGHRILLPTILTRIILHPPSVVYSIILWPFLSRMQSLPQSSGVSNVGLYSIIKMTVDEINFSVLLSLIIRIYLCDIYLKGASLIVFITLALHLLFLVFCAYVHNTNFQYSLVG